MATGYDPGINETPDTDMIYIQNLPLDVSEVDIVAHFGSIGVIKFDKKQVCAARSSAAPPPPPTPHHAPPSQPFSTQTESQRRCCLRRICAGHSACSRRQDKHKVWQYRDKATGQLKGDATVRRPSRYFVSARPHV